MQLGAGLQLLTTTECRRLLATAGTQALRVGRQPADPLHQGHGPLAIFARRSRRLAALRHGAPSGNGAALEPPPIVGGSHDPLLQWALAESRAGLAILPEGSQAGYERFARARWLPRPSIFTISTPATATPTSPSCAKRPLFMMRSCSPLQRASRVCWCRLGNPLGLTGLAQASDQQRRLVVRPDGAGAQQLLQSLLKRAGLAFLSVPRYGHGAAPASTSPRPSGADRARFGRLPRAPWPAPLGVWLCALCFERFDLLMRQRDYFRPPMQRLMALLRDPRFAAQAGELGGFGCVRRRAGALVAVTGNRAHLAGVPLTA